MLINQFKKMRLTKVKNNVKVINTDLKKVDNAKQQQHGVLFNRKQCEVLEKCVYDEIISFYLT